LPGAGPFRTPKTSFFASRSNEPIAAANAPGAETSRGPPGRSPGSGSLLLKFSGFGGGVNSWAVSGQTTRRLGAALVRQRTCNLGLASFRTPLVIALRDHLSRKTGAPPAPPLMSTGVNPSGASGGDLSGSKWPRWALGFSTNSGVDTKPTLIPAGNLTGNDPQTLIGRPEGWKRPFEQGGRSHFEVAGGWTP